LYHRIELTLCAALAGVAEPMSLDEYVEHAPELALLTEV